MVTRPSITGIWGWTMPTAFWPKLPKRLIESVCPETSFGGKALSRDTAPDMTSWYRRPMSLVETVLAMDLARLVMVKATSDQRSFR